MHSITPGKISLHEYLTHNTDDFGDGTKNNCLLIWFTKSRGATVQEVVLYLWNTPHPLKNYSSCKWNGCAKNCATHSLRSHGLVNVTLTKLRNSRNPIALMNLAARGVAKVIAWTRWATAADGESRTALASYEKRDAHNNNHRVFRFDDWPRFPSESVHPGCNVHARFVL